jgi:DNA-binding CsgD family transcriptional regulator
MPPRKFFYGDIVEFRDDVRLPRYELHHGHRGTVVKTKVLGAKTQGHRVIYGVDCQCGRQLKTGAGFLNLVAREGEGYEGVTPDQLRICNFLDMFIPLPFNDADMLLLGKDRFREATEEHVKELLRNLSEREKFILIKRYGLDGSGGKTLREVGEVLSISRARVEQLANKALRKIENLSWVAEWRQRLRDLYGFNDFQVEKPWGSIKYEYH